MEIVVGYHVLMVHYHYFIDWFILLLCPVNTVLVYVKCSCAAFMF